MKLILRFLKRWIIANIHIETKTEQGPRGPRKIFRVWFLNQLIFELKFDVGGGVQNVTKKEKNLKTSID